MNPEEIKMIVKEKYSQIARQGRAGEKASCCNTTDCCTEKEYTDISDDYSNLRGYYQDADLNLGCGIPTEFANINTGDTVVDLGSGAGNDCFVARSLVGDTGKVIGIDMTADMIEQATKNASKLNYKNVEFVLGEIEDLPLSDGIADVVISNCVLNLVPDKAKAFHEVYRILKKGGHFCVSDVVLKGTLPENLQKQAELYTGCVSGALQMEEYLSVIRINGFSNVEIKKQKQMDIPDEELLKYLSDTELSEFRKTGTGIFSITVSADRL